MKVSCKILLAMTIVLTAAGLEAKVTTDRDESIDISSFKTFSWIDGTPGPNPLGEKRLRAAVDSRLAAVGYTKVESGGDLKVTTHLRSNRQKRISVDDYGYGYGRWRRGYGSSTVHVSEFDVGTLVLDLIESESNELVWRGMATETIKSTSEKNEKLMNKVLDKMFKKWPD